MQRNKVYILFIVFIFAWSRSTFPLLPKPNHLIQCRHCCPHRETSVSHTGQKIAVFCSGMLMTGAPVTPTHAVFIFLCSQEQNSDWCLDISLISKCTVSTFSNRLECRDIIQSESSLWPVRCGQRICTKSVLYLRILAAILNNQNGEKGSCSCLQLSAATKRQQHFTTIEPFELNTI